MAFQRGYSLDKLFSRTTRPWTRSPKTPVSLQSVSASIIHPSCVMSGSDLLPHPCTLAELTLRQPWTGKAKPAS
jgi:hypothetical protein